MGEVVKLEERNLEASNEERRSKFEERNEDLGAQSRTESIAQLASMSPASSLGEQPDGRLDRHKCFRRSIQNDGSDDDGQAIPATGP